MKREVAAVAALAASAQQRQRWAVESALEE